MVKLSQLVKGDSIMKLNRQQRLRRQAPPASSKWRTFPYFKATTSVLVLTGIGFLGYGGYVVHDASANTQHVMQQSKSLKEVYGQGKQGQRERANRVAFDKLYAKYMTSDHSTLKHLDKPIPQTDVDQLAKLAKDTGVYYQDSYTDQVKVIQLIAKVQNDYIKLWAPNGVNHELVKTVTPLQIYQFNVNHYNDLQVLLALDANSQYPTWMTTQMQLLGQDAGLVEEFVHTFANYFDFPTKSKAWTVEHNYKSDVKQDLMDQYVHFHFKWQAISFLPDILGASDNAISQNEKMQAKYDQAMSLISSIKASSIASSQAKAASEAESARLESSKKQSSIDSENAKSQSIADSESASIQSEKDASSRAQSESTAKAESESRAKAEQESRTQERENAMNHSSSRPNESSSVVSSVPNMPNFVGKSVDDAQIWANKNNVGVTTEIQKDGNYPPNSVISQTKQGNGYHIVYKSA